MFEEGGADCSFTLPQEAQSAEGARVELVFQTVSAYYSIALVEVGARGVTRSVSSDNVVCKYIRREIRELTDDDREAYLRALHVFHRAGGCPIAVGLRSRR